MSDKERKLIRRIKRGNQHAFQTLYNRYVDDTIQTVYGITRNHNHTFDIVQETFIKVYRHLEKFDEEKPFKPWFHRILLNESMRYSKKEKSAIPIFQKVYMEISREENTTTEEVIERIKEEIEADAGMGIRREERTTEPIEAEMILGMGLDGSRDTESFGSEWNTPIHRYYVMDTINEQVFIIKQVYFLEAAEGHGARFHYMLESFEIAKE
ncbi:RNA polymerase sigma factor [Oceanobacillus alkalisoli]|uniref:RNA polymerase sigma factor n=1 Tax=Oceanobacillus alkalisoli TaxID=2925113 RepID=UPI001F11C91D|nr:sigma-70 family RNA polymerase sigma factor [Oceanobacillus alkalisoli]MCF3943543.1 sigma-70 family RNA polymerase sigma factor [Oceanobacillus alkalisoli]